MVIEENENIMNSLMKRQKKYFGLSLGQGLFPNCLLVRLGSLR